ncbi:MAG: right-handed parallel beta-helix repeat-containing protein [Cyclobacteriaceae bacterium]|nr:right-handed parallel beta-helix repeat-containing protein [Cyclobacteriaceae bacterium]
MTLMILLFIIMQNNHLQARGYDVLDFGAINDGKTINTRAIQQAIDQCARDGGGTVLIAGGGAYLTGTIYLKDNITLYIDNGTTLLGSQDINDYTTDTHKNMYKDETHMDRCLIFAKDANSIAIEGHGILDGNGYRSVFTNDTGRPMLLRFLNCTNIRIRDITLKNPASWTSVFLYCDDISVHGIKIHSRANSNGDGLNFDGCSKVRVSDCAFNTSDDSICLQTSLPDKPCHDITITNCTFTSYWAGIRIGLLSRGDFSRVSISNCTFRDIRDAGLKIQMNEGGAMKNMIFSNLVMENVPRPVFMTFCQQRACVDAPMELAPMNAMHDFIFQSMLVDNAALDINSAFFLTGLPGHYIENVIIRDVQFVVSGGGTKQDAKKDVKEFTPELLGNWWPEFHLTGTLPAHGIFLRHMKNVTIDNFQIRTIEKDERPAIIADDVKNMNLKGLSSNGKSIKQ